MLFILPLILMRYVDGYVLAVPTKNLTNYKKMATDAGKIWIKHGALQYVECVADDIKRQEWMELTFKDTVKAKKGETVVFAFVIYKSRKHRDQVNKKVMADSAMGDPGTEMPFDMKRMAYGGFEMLVDLTNA